MTIPNTNGATATAANGVLHEAVVAGGNTLLKSKGGVLSPLYHRSQSSAAVADTVTDNLASSINTGAMAFGTNTFPLGGFVSSGLFTAQVAGWYTASMFNRNQQTPINPDTYEIGGIIRFITASNGTIICEDNTRGQTGSSDSLKVNPTGSAYLEDGDQINFQVFARFTSGVEQVITQNLTITCNPNA